MLKQKKTLFISDLHLNEDHPITTQAFIRFLNQCDQSIDALYILGDLFETWIGDDDDRPFNRSIIQALKSATDKGLSIYFLHGNRDFLIGKRFLKETGCKLIHDEYRISLYGTSLLMMHGDTLCTRDKAYLRWRKISRHPILNTLLFLIFPLSIRRKFANKMREKSAHYTKSMNKEIMDVTQDEVERVMKNHAVFSYSWTHTQKSNTSIYARSITC